MTRIALIHFLWLQLVPSGALCLLGAIVLRRWAHWFVLLGLSLLVMSFPAVVFCQLMWPVDFLVPGREVRVSTTGSGYTVSVVQRPGEDFYDSFLEIRRADGKITRLMIDCDADKWWGLKAKTHGTRTSFIRGSGAVVAFVDFSEGTLSGSIDRKLYKLNGLSFDRHWSNGG
jgi:hypothetical protein